MQKKWKIMIILLTILIILYALTSCKEKIQEKKGNEDNWKVYQQLEEKEEQNIQNPFIREETKCILTEKEKPFSDFSLYNIPLIPSYAKIFCFQHTFFV